MIHLPRLRARIDTDDALDVRSFAVEQRMSEPFRVDLRVVSNNHAISLDEVLGAEASFALSTETVQLSYTGVCIEMELERVDARGLATYALSIAPRAWLMGQRKNRRIYQYLSELEIARALLDEWGVAHEARVDASRYKARKFRVQYDETDFAFMCRMLEDAGITFRFEPSEEGSLLVLDDEPQSRGPSHPALVYRDSPGVTDGRFVTRVTALQRVRPAKLTLGDLDYRRPSTNQPRLSATEGLAQERRLELFDHEPGVFLYAADPGGASPTADDRGTARTDELTGARKTRDRLLGARQSARRIRFESNVVDLAPGSTVGVVGHPHRLLSDAAGLLVVRSLLHGRHDGAYQVDVEAVPASLPYRPELITPKPKVQGLESATVVGPRGEEIHTDEYARVRVHFHWDRESRRDERSSCWVPTSQPWAGAGFGGVNLPRIGQEVLVEFLGGDPDRPVVVGRVYTETNPVPDPLPRFKSVSGIMSESTPRLVLGAADGGTAEAPTSLLGGGTPISPSELHSLVSEPGTFQAPSPTGTTHAWQGSGIKFSDELGQQMVYLQAQRDASFLVNNAWRTIVGNRRACMVGTDDWLEVGNKQGTLVRIDQTVSIGQDQKLNVFGNRSEYVQGTATLDVGPGGLHVRADEAINHQAARTVTIESRTRIELVVAGSRVVLEPDQITIHSGDRVYLQPAEGRGT